MSFENINIENIQKFWDKRPYDIRHSQAKTGTCKFFVEVERG
jgi:hypothetical protein